MFEGVQSKFEPGKLNNNIVKPSYSSSTLNSDVSFCFYFNILTFNDCFVVNHYFLF